MLGRDQELKRVKRFLHDKRVVWLHGAPGEGKSLLAAELGRSMDRRKQATAGVSLVNLKGARGLTKPRGCTRCRTWSQKCYQFCKVHTQCLGK